MEPSRVQEWTLDGVLDELTRIDDEMPDRQFAFILGAGASFKSGIPTGHDLAQRWLRDLHLRECGGSTPLEEWVDSSALGIPNLSFGTAAEHYPEIFERRFRGDRQGGYAALERVMEGKQPSLGYSLLAEIIQHTRHKVVVTTNFDNLVADALAMHAHQSPLVVAHESLTGFVQPKLRRPLVAKIHRDLFLDPINDLAGVSTMEEGWKIALRKLFQYFTPIVVGYGGNDGSLMGLLASLAPGDVVGRMFWCYREGSPPPTAANAVLVKHQGIQVKIPGFDEFMLLLAAKLVKNFDVAALADRTARLGQERADRYRKQAEELRRSSAAGTIAQRRMGLVLSQSVQQGKSWWAWEMQASSEADNNRRDEIYRQGLMQFPNSAELTGNYANFLADQRKDFDAAEAMYKKALELDPGHATHTGNYATFLMNQRKDFDAAEAMYKKALELDPGHATNTGNYATFLMNERKDFDAAEAMYKKALELDPGHATNTGNYATFLTNQRKDFDAAEAMYKKALELDPGHASNTGNYANFLTKQRKDFDAAEAMYRKALELDPGHATNTGNYAIYLMNQRKDFDAAETMYKKALELDPGHATHTGNYATFLMNQHKDFDAAEALYKKALELDPGHATHTGNYANFLANRRQDFDAAEAMFKKTLELAPDDARNTGNYAYFLANRRKDFDAAEVVFKKTLLRDPNNANNLANFASIQLIKSDPKGLLEISLMIRHILQIVVGVPSQAVAEALLYGCLQRELVSGPVGPMLSRLKGLLGLGYERGTWDFSLVFDTVLPRIFPEKHEFYRALGRAILDADQVQSLNQFDSWRIVNATDPFAEFDDQ